MYLSIFEKLSFYILFVVGGCGIALAGIQDRPVIECPVFEIAPVLDGVLDEPIWQRASVSPYLLDNDGGQDGDPQTRFRMYTDGKWLYVGIELADKKSSELSRKNLGHDNATWDETAEIFIAPDCREATYYQFAVNPGGADFDNLGMASHKDNNYTWNHAEKITSSGWTTEIAILLADIGRPTITTGNKIALNICRTTLRGKIRFQSWSPTGGMFHNRNTFGTVVVGSFSQAACTEVSELKKQYAALETMSENSSSLQQIKKTIDELNSLTNQLENGEAWKGFSKKVGFVNEKITKLAHAKNGLVVWDVSPWALPTERDLPKADQSVVQKISRTVFKDEYLTLALAIANMTDDSIDVRCVPSNFLSPDWSTSVDHSGILSVHQALNVGIKDGNSYRDPLPILTSSTPVSLSTGCNGIVWLTINTHNLNVGQWSCNLAIKPLIDHSLDKIVQLNLNVLPVNMPLGPKPYSANWPIYDRSGYVADQKSHYTNMHTHIEGGGILGKIKFDKEGNIESDPDFTKFDTFIDKYGTKDQLYVIADWYDWLPKQLGGGGTWGKKEQDNFTWAVKRVRKYFESKGMSVNDYAWYAHDEPSSIAAATSVANFGKLMHAADPEQQIFVTIYDAVTLEQLKIMAPYVNLWCPSLSLSAEKRIFLQEQSDSRRVSYQVNPRTTDSYWGYRMCATKAFNYGYEGVGFWCYDDGGGTIWDDTDACGRADYGVVYEAAEGPVTSVRWEAWRQGIQDYRYFEWLGKLAKSCSDRELAAQANALVSDIVNDNLTNSDKTTADLNNVRIRQMIVKVLCNSGKVDQQVISGLSKADSRVVCLTGNSGGLGTDINTGGSYTYNSYVSPDKGGERCGVLSGPIYFKGVNAVTSPQGNNKQDGSLTDGDLSYPVAYCINWYPPAVWSVTFDLNITASLGHSLIKMSEGKGDICVYVSNTKDGPWKKVSQVDLASDVKKSVFGDIILDLKKTNGRFVKFDFSSKGQATKLGEIRIFGTAELD